MSLERKDIRGKLHPDMHAALVVLAEAEHMDIAEWIECRLCEAIRARVHAATVIARAVERLGIAGTGRESAGFGGNGRECQGLAGNGRPEGCR